MYNTSMDAAQLAPFLDRLPLGAWRFCAQIDSTNSEAARWVEAGTPELALVVADEQTAGRGRLGRRWLTPPGAALAFSLVLRPQQWMDRRLLDDPQQLAARLTALGALAVCETLHLDYSLPALIKWPNDVLIERRKTAGILAEAHWQGGQLTAAILGIGLNVTAEAAPPEAEVLFPATSVQSELGRVVERPQLLGAILARLLGWIEKLADPGFLQAWEDRLAFKGEWVYLSTSLDGGPAGARRGRLLGLDDQGRLRLQSPDGQAFCVETGEVHLRPALAGPQATTPSTGG